MQEIPSESMEWITDLNLCQKNRKCYLLLHDFFFILHRYQYFIANQLYYRIVITIIRTYESWFSNMRKDSHMDWLTDEALYYGGMLVSACSLLLGIVYCVLPYIRKIRLNIQLDEEYGKTVKTSKEWKEEVCQASGFLPQASIKWVGCRYSMCQVRSWICIVAGIKEALEM